MEITATRGQFEFEYQEKLITLCLNKVLVVMKKAVPKWEHSHQQPKVQPACNKLTHSSLMFDFYTTEKWENLNPLTLSVSIEMEHWAFKLFK